MLTKRQNLIETIRGGSPDRLVNQYEAFSLLLDPIFMDNAGPGPGEPDASDGFGVWYSWPEGQPGAFPLHTPDRLVCHDVTRWREEVRMPRHRYSEAEWEPWVAAAEAVDRAEQFACAFVIPGLFEQCHHLMGVSEALMAFYEEPRAMAELIDYLVEWELLKAEAICDHLRPDALFHHDDWGSYDSTFLRPEMFDEFFLDAYKRVYGYWRSRGAELIVHHSDSYAATLVPSMIEMGVDIWQGAMLSNDLPGLIGRYGGQISLMGGLENARLDVVDWSREAIDAEVARVCGECGAHYFIPSLCAGNEESCVPPVYDEVTRATAAQLGELAAAVAAGKRKRAVALTEEALAAGHDPHAVLDDALVAAMDGIGERFSAGEAFMPEMLVAARAMAACAEVLAPHLAEAGAEPVGRAVIGTVRGDMHDIGKNLVRMMIESKGFEVADLGVDVAPEQFAAFVQEHPDTDLVCLSALLTTTMPAMADTIRALEEAGLRDCVKVMVGGAPVTQAFADEVGADAYTSDAGAAAACAVELVRG